MPIEPTSVLGLSHAKSFLVPLPRQSRLLARPTVSTLRNKKVQPQTRFSLPLSNFHSVHLVKATVEPTEAIFACPVVPLLSPTRSCGRCSPAAVLDFSPQHEGKCCRSSVRAGVEAPSSRRTSPLAPIRPPTTLRETSARQSGIGLCHRLPVPRRRPQGRDCMRPVRTAVALMRTAQLPSSAPALLSGALLPRGIRRASRAPLCTHCQVGAS